RLWVPAAYWSRGLFSASSTGCSPVACQGSPLTATRSERTGAMASIRRWRMTDARLGALRTLGGDDFAQAHAQLGVHHRVPGGKLGQLLQELLVLLGPVD